MEVSTVTSPGGIQAWLVEDYTVPTFALHFAFKGGVTQDPIGKEGLTNFLVLLMQQGGGDYSPLEYEQRLERLAIRVQFNPASDVVKGAIEALSETRSEAAQLVSLALGRPRFDEETIDRVRRMLLGFHGGEARRAENVADSQWNAVAFDGHPCGRPGAGSAASVNAITAEDLKTYHRRAFAKDRVKAVAVGDITADELGQLIDQMFGGLPAMAELVEVPIVRPVVGGRLRVAEIDVPQSVVTFGSGVVPYASPDYVPARLLAEILGGSSVASRLGRELREKRGLAFSALAWLEPREGTAVLRGRVATRNDMVGATLEIIRTEMQKMADGHLDQGELDDAKSFMVAAHLLSPVSNRTVAAELLRYSVLGFSPDFVKNIHSLIRRVNLSDAKRVASYLLDPENLIISIAGTPSLQPART